MMAIEIIQHLWTYVWGYFWGAVALYIFLIAPLRSWRRRRRLRRALRELVGDGFRNERSYASSAQGLALVVDSVRGLAYADTKKCLFIKPSEIVDLIWQVQLPMVTLTVVTTNEDAPRLQVGSLFKTSLLQEINSRLKLMRDQSKAATIAPTVNSVAEGNRLEESIDQLAKAVLSLVDAVNQINSKK
jgi:hypothetical protein